MRELRDLMRVLAGLAVLSASACGDDDADGDDGRRDAAVRDAGGEREGDEGWPCTAPAECNGDLVCAGSPITVSGVPIGVCGRPCEGDEGCGGGRCISYTGDREDAHCADVVETEFELCGVADTSICAEGTICLYLPRSPVGVCVKLCALDGSSEPSGGDEDGGVPALGECSAEQTCIDGVLANPDPGEGVCGTTVARGAPCGVDLGLFCSDGDVCAPEDPSDGDSTRRCFED